MHTLLQGIYIGFILACSIGPIALLCIQRTIQLGLSSGLATGLGAATGDAFYGLLTAGFLTSVSAFIHANHTLIRLLGGTLLVILGIRAIRNARVHLRLSRMKRQPLIATYAATTLLTLGNPQTIITFSAIFASLKLSAAQTLAQGIMLVVGVFVGSALCFALITLIARFFFYKLDDRLLGNINYGVGLAIGALGITVLVQALTA